jgi:uncharacterized membrane protein
MVPAAAAVPLGAYVVLSRGGRWHKPAGRIWAALMIFVAGTSFWITGVNGARWSPIHLLSVLTLVSVPYAVWRVRRGQVTHHRRAMLGIFGGLLVAGGLALSPSRSFGGLVWSWI